MLYCLTDFCPAVEALNCQQARPSKVEIGASFIACTGSDSHITLKLQAPLYTDVGDFCICSDPTVISIPDKKYTCAQLLSTTPNP